MLGYQSTKSFLAGTACAAALAANASATEFNIPQGDLRSALSAYAIQTGTSLVYVVSGVQGVHTQGVHGDLSSGDALARILKGTGFVTRRYPSGAIGIDRDRSSQNGYEIAPNMVLAQASPPQHAAVETVTVTSSKLGGGDVQSVPIAITALSQEQLTSRQVAGGPDLVKEVPNLTFSKTNFTGYNIQIRGIGTQAISVTTDPAVAVALNDTPFIRNHFFEQEFYDISQAEVLRGPQGTLYGRNATAGVVNVVTAKPTDQFEAMASADVGNYDNRRFEGMVNIPVVDDRLDLRVAGEWTKRDGYSFNTLTNAPIDGRDLWSSRVTIGWKPASNVQTYLVWEHFQENDDRLRTGKQLCKTAEPPSSVGGASIPSSQYGSSFSAGDYLSQGCAPASLYSPDSFEVPFGYSLPYYSGLVDAGVPVRQHFDVYASTTQSRNLRNIESSLNPSYKAKNDTLELNTDYSVAPALTLTSQTGYNSDSLWSTEDYNRFNSAPGVFVYNSTNSYSNGNPLAPDPAAGTGGIPADSGIFCDPQLGCSNRLVAQDLSDEHAWQLSQEFRLASHFSGPLNFSIGGSYLHYETEENYYVFINTLSLFSSTGAPQPSVLGVTDNSSCLLGSYKEPTPSEVTSVFGCKYIDTNPIDSLNDQGHNYFLSQNPYTLNSYAGFGEVYYNITDDVKLTGGLRWTDDRKHFIDIPSELLIPGYGYTVTNVIDQQWSQLTGRAAVNWTPKLDFTDQTLAFASYAHGYKAGGANPPGAVFPSFANANIVDTNPIHPLTFKPEFIDAYELGTKNTLLNGGLTLNGDIFYYDYKNYQISRIVDRTAINDNFNATVRGAELEANWEPSPGLKFSFAGGYENATLDKGDQSIDLMDRTAGTPGWIVVKPYITTASNCILPAYVVAAALENGYSTIENLAFVCGQAYDAHHDPATGLAYVQNPTITNVPPGFLGQTPPAGYPGFDPLSVDPAAPANVNNGLGLPPNNGEGFAKDLSGKQLPNAPHFTVSASADYTIPLTAEWAGTAHIDYYWQDYSWARVFNDDPYDRIRGYTNVNLALILTNQDGWQVMGYLKNVFNVTAITGDFLNSDDTGLTTNVFLTDPRLYGVRITKNW